MSDRVDVAVVGAGHVAGMVKYQGVQVDREALSVIPPPSRVTQALKWVIPALMLAAFWFGYQKHAGTGLYELVMAWLLPSSLRSSYVALERFGLIIVILLQESKGGGLAEAFGGIGAETFGVKSGGINRFTFGLAGLFLGSAILIQMLWNVG